MYISPKIQIKFIIFNRMIRDQISDELQRCQYFTIVVDETKNITKFEQVILEHIEVLYMTEFWVFVPLRIYVLHLLLLI